MKSCQIRWGYPDETQGQGGHRSVGAINITPEALTIKRTSSAAPIRLSSDQVVSIQAYHSFMNRNVINIEHTAFETVGDVRFTPVGMTASQFILAVKTAGFKATGSMPMPWNPSLGPPPVSG